MDIELARFNMVEQQVRPWEVLDPRVLDLLTDIKREDFLPTQYKDLAFADMDLPIGHGQIALSPKIQAKLIQAVDIKDTDSVLEVGTGSGFMTAMIAELADRVVSVDIIPEFKKNVEALLSKYEIANVTLEVGDASQGWSNGGPFDVIIIGGSMPYVTDGLKDCLKVGGRLIAIEGENPVQKATLFILGENKKFHQVEVFETASVPALKNAPVKNKFVF